MSEIGDRAERESDFGDDPAAIVRRWKTELGLSEKGRRGKWLKRVKRIVRRYCDELPSEQDEDIQRPARFNALWANIQTMGPAIYARAPKPVVERRYLDRDPAARAACVLLERPLALQIEASGYHDVIKQARLDYLLTAQGVAWVRYEPTYKAMDTQLSDGEAEPAQEIASEKICVDYVHYSDFRCSAARTWAEVSWVAKREFLEREQLIERFGEDIGSVIPLDYSPKDLPDDLGEQDAAAFKKAEIWEIWDKSKRQVIFIAKAYLQGPLQVVDDPLRLDGFWPCPRPLFGTLTNDSVVPVPDYVEYQDQASELDSLTARISSLTKSIKAAGVYDASQSSLKRLLDEGCENELIPVDNWAAFGEKGGLPGAISMLPVKELADVLLALYQARTQVKQDLDEITGISDIVRGQTDPNETLGAQQLKSNYSTLRLSDRQAEMARFCRDIIAIMAEIIAEHFQPETMALMASYEQYAKSQAPDAPPPAMVHNGGPPMEAATPDPAILFQKAIALLKDERLRGFRIDIETDSTIEPDAEAEKASRVEFLTAASGFMQQSIEIAAVQPEIAPLLGKMLLFGVRGFRAGRELEAAFENFIDKLDKAAANPQPKPPGPEEIKAQAEAQKIEMEMQGKQAEIAARAQELHFDAKTKRDQAQIAMQASAMEMAIKEREHAMRLKEMERKGHLEEIKFGFELERMRLQMGAELQKMAMQREMMDAEADREAIKQ